MPLSPFTAGARPPAGSELKIRIHWENPLWRAIVLGLMLALLALLGGEAARFVYQAY
jgi:hypothetical protein